MTTAIREYDVVRIRSLDGVGLDGGGLGCRAPTIGDIGVVVTILSAEDPDDTRHETYLVECIQADATTAWIASFPIGALEVVSRIEHARGDEVSR
jgi:hypothetical protein